MPWTPVLTGSGVVVATEEWPDPLTEAIALLRPHLDVARVDPRELREEVERHRPDLVIYSAPDEAVEANVAAWALLYPDGGNVVLVAVGEERRTLPSPNFADLLALVDEVTGPAG